MQFSTLLLPLTLLLTSALARPTFDIHDIRDWFPHRESTSPAVPPSALAAPPSGLSLKYVALGVGVQNYTCAGDVATPIGAVAALYDAMPWYARGGSSESVNKYRVCAADRWGWTSLRRYGTHYFDAAGTPTFDLWGAGALLAAKKLGGAAAPTDACTGRNGMGAVDWLQLADNGAGVSRGGVSMVYRVRTAGGKAPACAGQTALSSDYATEYWFYG